MRRRLALALAAVLSLSLIGCGSGQKQGTQNETKAAETTAAAGGTETQGETVSSKDTIIMASNVEPATLDPSGLDLSLIHI